MSVVHMNPAEKTVRAVRCASHFSAESTTQARPYGGDRNECSPLKGSAIRQIVRHTRRIHGSNQIWNSTRTPRDKCAGVRIRVVSRGLATGGTSFASFPLPFNPQPVFPAGNSPREAWWCATGGVNGTGA